MSNWTMSRRPYKSATSPPSRICSSLQTTSTEIRDCSTAGLQSPVVRVEGGLVGVERDAGADPRVLDRVDGFGSHEVGVGRHRAAVRRGVGAASRFGPGGTPNELVSIERRRVGTRSAEEPSPSPPLAIAGSPSPETGRSTARRRRTGAAPRSRGRGARRSLMSTGKLRLDALERNREGTRRVAPPAGGRTTGPSRGRGRWSRARGDRPGRTPPVRARQSKWNACRSTSPVPPFEVGLQRGASSRRPRSGEDRRGPRRRRSSTRARPPGRGSGTPGGTTIRMPESTGSTRSGTRNSSPGSISGGCPRRVGNDRSGLVVWRAEPSSDTASISDSGSVGVSIVPCGNLVERPEPERDLCGGVEVDPGRPLRRRHGERRREREVQLRRGGVDPDVVRPRGHRVGVAAGEQRAVAAAGLDNSDARGSRWPRSRRSRSRRPGSSGRPRGSRPARPVGRCTPRTACSRCGP